MREIKFRGKDDQNVWHYGDLIHEKHFSYILDINFLPALSLPATSFIEIDPATVGQFTELKDKNGKGKEVYGGDLFEVVYSNVPNGFSAMNFEKEVKINIGEVVFKFGGFKIKTFHPDRKEFVYMDLHVFLKNEEKVVIGNVHQNKALLES